MDPDFRQDDDARTVALADAAETAARLCKADLVTGMVGEFPELQGIIGGHLARAQGLGDDIANAIRDHYKPVGQGDEVPTDPVTVAVSLADKLDTLTHFFWIDERPSGSRDPFALRRAAIAIASLIIGNELRLDVVTLVMRGLRDQIAEPLRLHVFDHGIPSMDRLKTEFAPALDDPTYHETWSRLESVKEQIGRFLIDRLKVQQREAGVRHDLIDAVFALGGEDDLVRLLARVRALQDFVGTADGANLLSLYKRAANILKKEGWVSPEEPRHPELVSGSTSAHEPAVPVERWTPDQVRGDGGKAGDEGLSYSPEPCEAALAQALDSVELRAAAAIEAEDFERAMTVLSELRTPIDAFFDAVTIVDPDPTKRAARLALLARVRDAVDRVADFSKIEG